MCLFLFARISVFVNLLVGLSSTPWPKEKWQRPEILNFSRPYPKTFFSKSTGGEQAVSDILIFTRIYVFPSVCLTPFDQTKRRQTWNWLHTLPETIYKNANVKIDQFSKMQLLHVIIFLYWIFILTQENYWTYWE